MKETVISNHVHALIFGSSCVLLGNVPLSAKYPAAVSTSKLSYRLFIKYAHTFECLSKNHKYGFLEKTSLR